MAPHASIDEYEVTGVTDTQAVIMPDPIMSKNETSVFTVDHVLPHRQKAAPLATTVAAFSSADMFKSKAASQKPKAKRWDYRISEESKARKPSSLKGAMKHLNPNTISLCGGLPSRYVIEYQSTSTVHLLFS